LRGRYYKTDARMEISEEEQRAMQAAVAFSIILHTALLMV
jgi:hypothetical protein